MNTATQVYGLYLRRVTLGRRTILALGAKFQAAEGDVRLVLMDEVDRRPGRILAFGTVPALDAVTDEKGEQHGAEYIFTDPITPTGEAFWIGFESTETVQLIDLGKPDELLLPSAQELTIGASFAPEVMTPLGGLDGSPYVYAIYL